MDTLNHLSRLLTPLSGTDKGLRIIQYSLKLLLWGVRKAKKEDLAKGLSVIGRKFSEAGTIHRVCGLVDTVIGCRTNTEKDKILKIIYDLQNVTMLLYYPAEDVWGLDAVGVIRGIEDPDRVSRWSCFACAAYIVLEMIAEIYE
eukprot:EC720386.1.p1 GENE.EC720386.1~~EC720386.1.p1  ORF type:complete len:144 (+),score=14.31 EC720386.1:76-507(+)